MAAGGGAARGRRRARPATAARRARGRAATGRAGAAAGRGAPGVIVSARAPEPVGAYPHARRVGNLLFLSGIGPRRRGSPEIPGVTLDGEGRVVAHDIEAQCHAAFENVRVILEDAGSSWEKIVDVTIFLTNMQDDFPAFNRLYATYFKANRPARTTVEVGRLPTPIAIELKVIATID